MGEAHLPRVEQEIGQSKLLLKKDVLLVVPMFFVPDDIVTDMRQVSADLVGSACEQIDFQQCVATGRVAARGVEGNLGVRDYVVASLGFLKLGRPLAGQWMVDQVFFDRGDSADDAQIRLFYGSIHEFGFERREDFFFFCKKQCAASRPIQAMDGGNPGSDLVAELDQGVFIFPESLSSSVYQQPGRLVDDDQIFVFKEDV